MDRLRLGGKRRESGRPRIRWDNCMAGDLAGFGWRSKGEMREVRRMMGMEIKWNH